MPRSTASAAVFALAIGSHASGVIPGKPHELVKLQLYKHQQLRMELPHRLEHQQARARRRALEEASGTVNGTFALSESSLGVGFGCVRDIYIYMCMES